MSDVEIPSTPAQAVAFSGCAERKVTIWSGSQDLLFRVPPYRPGVLPANDPPDPAGGVTPAWSTPAGGMKGFGPGVCTGSRSVSPELDPPIKVTATAPP